MSMRVVAAVVVAGVASVCLGDLLTQVDTFDSDTMNWDNTFGTSTTNWISTGGPGGDGDAFMKIGTNGQPSGAGSRLGAWNQVQWQGDYIGLGITAFQMDIAGFEGPGVELRMMFLSNLGSVFTMQNAVPVPTDGVWRTYTFDISEANMVQMSGTPPFDEAFTDVGRVFIWHQPGAPAGFGGAPAYDGWIGVDNIRVVPAVGAMPVLITAMAAGAVRRRAEGRGGRARA